MKKSILLLAFAATIFVACDEDDKGGEQPKTNSELIVGKWTSTEVSSYTYDQTNMDTTDSFSLTGPFISFEFMSNGTLSSGLVGDTAEVGTYKVNGSVLTMITDGDTTVADITTLTNSKLVLDATDIYTENGVTYKGYTHVELAK